MEAKLKSPLPKPLLLKDYLLDDLSSCSSNGFRSYPRRRECCTTVRFLLETDLRANPPQKPVVYITGRATAEAAKPAPTASVVSAIQRASRSVLNAVKHLQFSAAAVKSAKAAKQSKAKKPILPRSLSRKLLRRSFKKKTIDRKEIERWKVYNQLTEKESNPSSFSPAKQNVAADSNSSTSESNSKSNSWSDSDFTISGDSSCSSDVNSTEAQNDAVVAKSPSVSVAVTNSIPSANNSPNAKKQLWSNEEKEQFSPVSVLDCPFEDEDEASSSFQDKLNLVEGKTNKKLMKKMQRFECATKLEPLNLVKRITFSDSENESPLHNFKEKSRAESKAAALLHQLMKARTPSCRGLKLTAAEKLLMDFFLDRIVDNGGLLVTANDAEHDQELIQVAEDWINGKSRRFLYEWEVKKNRKAYIEDMESGGKWKKMDEENGELAVQLEDEVFTSLVNELLVDLV